MQGAGPIGKINQEMRITGLDNMFSLLQAAIGAYLLYTAVTGRGKVLENEFLKVPREEYVKKLRILSAIAGVILCATTALEYFGVVVPGSPLSWVTWALGFAPILAMMFYTSKCTDKQAAKAGHAAAAQAPDHKEDPLRAAFVFDEEDGAADPKEGPGGTQ